MTEITPHDERHPGGDSGNGGNGSRRGNGETQLSLGTAAARNLTTTTKTVPQMQGISSRWLLRMLPWVQVSGGTYRVNRRLIHTVDGGLVSFGGNARRLQVVPGSLRQIPLLAGVADDEVLAALAKRFDQQEVEAGATIVEQGRSADRLYLVARGKVQRIGAGPFDDPALLGMVADGGHFGQEVLTEPAGTWRYSAVASTSCTLLTLSRRRFLTALRQSELLAAQVEHVGDLARRPQNRRGEADIALASGHHGEPRIHGTFADYDGAPREYPLSVAQTVLRVHTRVADLYSDPMDQMEQQLRLTVEAVRERQEHEMVNHRELGLLHNVDQRQRFQTYAGPPTPDDLDELLSRRRRTRMFLAHPQAIAAFGRECSRRGVVSEPAEVEGSRLTAWRGVPIFPCDKIPIARERTSSILAMRTGLDHQGVVGLQPTGIPDEHEPGLNVRFMGIDRKGVISYLVSAYYSVAVLVPDALGVLENVEVSHAADER